MYVMCATKNRRVAKRLKELPRVNARGTQAKTMTDIGKKALKVCLPESSTRPGLDYGGREVYHSWEQTEKSREAAGGYI